MRPVTYITSMVRSFRHSPGLAAQYLAQDALRFSVWAILSPLVAAVLVMLVVSWLLERAVETLKYGAFDPVMTPIWSVLNNWRSGIKTRLIARRKAWEAERKDKTHD